MEPIALNAQTRQALLQRVQDILLRPRPTWEQIDAEDGSAARIYTGYLIFLAAIPAIASFIGYSLVGVSGFGLTVRVPIVQGLVSMMVSYVLSLVIVYVLALIANALAPRYQGRQDMGSALKLIAYGATAGMLAGVFNLLPALAMLGMLGGLYSIYLIYTGIPVLMKAPQEKATAYTAVLIACGIVAMLLLMGVMHLLTPGTRSGLAGLEGGGGSATIEMPGTQIKIDANKVAEAARKLEQASQGSQATSAGNSGSTGTPADADSQRAAVEAIAGALGGILGRTTGDASAPGEAASGADNAAHRGAANADGAGAQGQNDDDKNAQREQAQRKLEQAQAGGSAAEVEAAMKEMMQATFGKAQPLKPQQLREQLPDTLAGLARGAVKTQSQSVMGMQSSELNATYGEGERAVRLTITDRGAAGSALSGLMAFAGLSESEDDDSVERSYREGETTIRESYQKDGSRSHLTLHTASGMEIKAQGTVSMQELKPGVLALAQKLQAVPRDDQ